MATVQSIFDRITFVTKDVDRVRWTLGELSLWLNDAAHQIASLHPRAAADFHELTLAAGSRQDLRRIDPDKKWLRMYEIDCTMVDGHPIGRVARQIPRPALDRAFPKWRSQLPIATFVTEYALDERSPFTFDVNPPVAEGVAVYALAAVSPPPCAILNEAGTDLANPNEQFPLSPGYDIPAVDYVLFRAFSKDANDPSYVARSNTHLQAFQLAMGVETKDASVE